MPTTATDVTTIEPIDHREGTRLAEAEYDRFVTALEALDHDDWTRPTDCEEWTVRDMAGHHLGAMRAAASMREQLRQQREITRRVKADGGNEVDHMTALQVELTADLDVTGLVAESRSLVATAARGRRRIPAPLRRFVKIPVEMGTIAETWTLGYLIDRVLTRDTWMHRVDLAQATGADLDLDAAHDGRIVADVVADWAPRHGAAVELTLTGPAGGHFVAEGSGDPEFLELDAVEFCRILSGRGEADGLLATQAPF